MPYCVKHLNERVSKNMSDDNTEENGIKRETSKLEGRYSSCV